MLSSLLFLLGLAIKSQLDQNVSSQQNVSLNQYVVKPDELSFQVSLYNITPIVPLCGGCLINPLYIVTAAHCVYGRNNEDMAAVAGIRHVLKNIEIFSVLSHTRSIKEIIIHPEFDPQLCSDDIALVRLKLPFKSTKDIGYARLPNLSVYIKESVNSIKMGTVFGYKLFNKRNVSEFTTFNQLLKFNASLVDIEECKMKYQEIPYNVNYYLICAYELFSSSESTATHSLDSGSPLVIDDILIGIHSCAPSVPNLPIIFTQVFSYNEWIIDKVFSNSDNDNYLGVKEWKMGLHFGEL